MSVYTVHEPPPRADEAAADPERFVFVRDGFHFWAFVLGPLWMLWHRLWLVFFLYVVLSVLLQIGLWSVGATPGVKFLISLPVSVLIGLEASTLRRWTLARRGRKMVGVVVADDLEAAERRFFDAWIRRSSTGWAQRPAWDASQPPVAFHAPGAHQPAVIGLFPEPGVQR